MTTSDHPDSFDFKSDSELPNSFAMDYLRQYYGADRPVTDDETAVFNFIRKINSRLMGSGRCLELGCGPTVHHAIMLAPLVSEIDFADYLETNLEFVKKWQRNDPDSWDWRRYAEFCLKAEGGASDAKAVDEREALTRSKMRDVFPVNLLSSPPLLHGRGPYDVVSAFYCTEEVARSVARWKEIMVGVASLVTPAAKGSPGGFLLMSCLSNSNFYHILSADGAVRDLPCANLSVEIVRSTLEDLGFDPSTLVCEEFSTPEQQAEGVPGVIMVLAQRL